jgi:hypothetical protein
MTGCDYQTIVGPDVELPPDQRDTYFLENEPTIPPSWHGLTIDVSTKDEVLATVKELNYVDPDLIGTPSGGYMGQAGESINVNCKSIPRERCLEFQIVDNRLMQVKIYPHFRMTFSEVADYLGPPDYLGVDPNIEGCSLTMFWSELQIMVSHRELNQDYCNQVWDSGKVSPDINADWYRYDSEIWYTSYFPRDYDFPFSGFEK